MSKIVIENLFDKEITMKDSNCKVIELIHENYMDWMRACGKKGKCTGCKMIVTEGMDNLSPLNPIEKQFRQDGRSKENEGLCYQSQLLHGNLRIGVAPEYKFAYLHYSD